MKTTIIYGTVFLADGKPYKAQMLSDDCGKAKACVCGFCKAPEQCSWGDCSHVRPQDATGTLCVSCSDKGYGVFPGHRSAYPGNTARPW